MAAQRKAEIGSMCSKKIGKGKSQDGRKPAKKSKTTRNPC